MMNNIERLRQYIGKASFSSAVDKLSALECLEEIEAELASKADNGVMIDEAQYDACKLLDEMVLRDA
jgi:hypothetical protein